MEFLKLEEYKLELLLSVLYTFILGFFIFLFV